MNRFTPGSGTDPTAVARPVTVSYRYTDFGDPLCRAANANRPSAVNARPFINAIGPAGKNPSRTDEPDAVSIAKIAPLVSSPYTTPGAQEKGPGGWVVTVERSLAGFGSRSFPVTVAVLVSTPLVPAATVAVTVMPAVAPTVNGERTHRNTPAAMEHPGVDVVAPVNPGGRVSITVEPDDAPGP
jgi:hypothetical protein